MTKHFVRVLADVDCEWQGLNPVYRVYVNDELFTERTWYWIDEYLEERLQIEAEPGDYLLRWELVPPHLAQLTVKNLRIDPIIRHRTDSQGIPLWEIYERASNQVVLTQASVTQQEAWDQAHIQLQAQGLGDITQFNSRAATELVHTPAHILDDACTLRITA
jgi:hypothetical protein